jgi:hypothetical protein
MKPGGSVTAQPAGRPGFYSRQRLGFHSSCSCPDRVKGTWFQYTCVRQPNECDLSPASSAEVMNTWSYTSIPPYDSLLCSVV